MKKPALYRPVWCLAAIVLVFVACSKAKRQMPHMYPPYMYRDKEPMGTNIAYRLLPQQFSGDIVLASKKTNTVVNAFSYLKGTVYISVGKNITLNDETLEQLLNYVERGNEFFLSANNIDYRLLDTLRVKYNYEWLQKDGAQHRTNTFLQLADTGAFGTKRYGFFYYPFAGMFTAYDSTTTTVLGINDRGHPNYIVVRYGKGKFYFHTEPAAFSNYFLLSAGNTGYFSEVFSYLNKDAPSVFWADTDQFGKRKDDFSALAIFWKNPPLKYALLIACALMLLYIAFGSKRKRRLIPALPANENASLSFVHTIGNLYLQKKDNRNIAVKKITYFLEYVRNSYHINTNNINTEFVQALSRKSGIAENRVQELVEKAADINHIDAITDHELFDINNRIDEFYKR